MTEHTPPEPQDQGLVEAAGDAIDRLLRGFSLLCAHTEAEGTICLAHPNAGVMCQPCADTHLQRHVVACAQCGIADRIAHIEVMSLSEGVRAWLRCMTLDGRHVGAPPQVKVAGLALCTPCRARIDGPSPAA